MVRGGGQDTEWLFYPNDVIQFKSSTLRQLEEAYLTFPKIAMLLCISFFWKTQVKYNPHKIKAQLYFKL